MEQALEDQNLGKTLAERGKQRAATFDWQRCAQETVAIFKKGVA
jgi:glycosyltransferase involved in cell wall biosynthesis